jgi:adenosylcobyric acid synthase
VDGLHLLPIETRFELAKQTHQVCLKRMDGTQLQGYEIHVGETTLDDGVDPFGVIIKRGGQSVYVLDGAVRADKKVWGTYVHGVFDNDDFRQDWLTQLGWCRGESDRALPDYDRLADAVDAAMDGDLLARILDLDGV